MMKERERMMNARERMMKERHTHMEKYTQTHSVLNDLQAGDQRLVQ